MKSTVRRSFMVGGVLVLLCTWAVWADNRPHVFVSDLIASLEQVTDGQGQSWAQAVSEGFYWTNLNPPLADLHAVLAVDGEVVMETRVGVPTYPDKVFIPISWEYPLTPGTHEVVFSGAGEGGGSLVPFWYLEATMTVEE